MALMLNSSLFSDEKKTIAGSWTTIAEMLPFTTDVVVV